MPIPEELPGIVSRRARCGEGIVEEGWGAGAGDNRGVGEVAIQFGFGGGNVAGARRFGVSPALVGGEEKGLIFAVVELGDPYRPTYIPAILVLPEGGGRCGRISAEVRKRIARVEGVVPQVFPKRSVKRICARLGYKIDNSAQYAAEFGLIVMGLDFELLNVIDDRGYIVRAGESGRVDDPVEIVEILAIPLTLGRRKRVGRARNSGGPEPCTVANASIL